MKYQTTTTLGVARDASAEDIKKAYAGWRASIIRWSARRARPKSALKEVAEAYEVLRDPEKRAATTSSQQLAAGPGVPCAARLADRPGGAGEQPFGRAGFRRTRVQRFLRSRCSAIWVVEWLRLWRERAAFRVPPDRGGWKSPGRGVYHGGGLSLQLQLPERAPADPGRSRRTRTFERQDSAGSRPGRKSGWPAQGGAGSAAVQRDLVSGSDDRAAPAVPGQGPRHHPGSAAGPVEAALAARSTWPTLGGPVTLSIPANARNGQQLRCADAACPASRPADQFAVLRIVNPPADTGAARELFQRMARELPFDPRAHWGQ